MADYTHMHCVVFNGNGRDWTAFPWSEFMFWFLLQWMKPWYPGSKKTYQEIQGNVLWKMVIP